MTRQHFDALAKAIASLPPNPTPEEVAEAIAGVCEAFNRNFDPDRFRVACKA